MDEAARAELADRTRYDAGAVEAAVLERWLDARAFETEADDPGEPFAIAIPPPNVTGALHMGHALNGSIQDVLIRLRRMQGRNALWIYGTDHAGIGLQNVIERLLRDEGKTRHDLGREAFIERVWEWRRETGTTITGQFQRLGCSLDYRRERFTMDEPYQRAVRKVFVELHRRGYLFRDNRMINWCPRCATAISDLEVRHSDVDDVLYELDYPVEGGGHLTVATVRPATLLGDTGVAVNPADPRYEDMVGRTVTVPLAERQVPVVADDRVEIGFGTGALKITPAHDPNDFEIGRSHGLAEVQVIGFDGHMTAEAGERYAGLTSAEAHERVLGDLRAAGLVRAETPYRHSVGHCDRCGTRVEPLVSLQWFCRMDEMAAAASAAVRDGSVRFHPEGAARIYFSWMDGIRPWCVSRQLWWGHQLPVWYCACGETIVQEAEPAVCPTCAGSELERDPDVLDTWFSSALWPYATLGWPDATDDLATFYPGHVLSTARDIINLWVARMLMTGIELLGPPPFADVVVHSVIQAPDGRRMSKSLGTGTDPLDLIERFGADATRYGLLKMSSTQDVRFAEGAIDEGRGLANKLWNAARLVLLNAAPEATPEPRMSEPVDRWILGRLDAAIEEVTGLIDGYEFSLAVKAIYRFVWNDFCDWYIEAAKLRLYAGQERAHEDVSATLLYVLDRTLRLCHPVLPHVTEEIWRYLPGERPLLVRSEAARAGEVQRDKAAEAAVSEAIELVSELRRLRQDAELAPRTQLRISIDEGAGGLRTCVDLLEGLAHVTVDGAGQSGGVPIAVGGATVRVLSDDLVRTLRPRLERRLNAARGEAERASRKLADDRFASKAPAHLVDAERDKAERYGREVGELERRLAALGAA